MNTVRFLRKHRTYFEGELGVGHLAPALSFALDRLASAWRKATA
jgi:hypothetical protein